SEDDDDVDAIVDAEEDLLIAEAGGLVLDDEEDDDDDDDDDEDDSDDENSPKTSFQARLERLRNLSKGKGKKPASRRMEIDAEEWSGEDEDDYDYFDRADEDEDFIERIETLLGGNEGLVTSKDRKARNKLFRAVLEGDFSDMDDSSVFKPALC
ncbi:hypothetical protein H0H93_001809, partial [Arthromyces matolae]